MEHVDLSEAFAESVEADVNRAIAEQQAEAQRPLTDDELTQRVAAHRAQIRRLIEDEATLAVLLVVTSGNGVVVDLGNVENAKDALAYLDDPAVTGGLALVAGKDVAVLSFGMTPHMAAAAALAVGEHAYDDHHDFPTVNSMGCGYTVVSYGMTYEDKCLAYALFTDFNRQEFRAGAVRPKPLAVVGG